MTDILEMRVNNTKVYPQTHMNAIEGFKETGNIIDSGLNGTDYYIKFEDGTMICCLRQVFEGVTFTEPWGALFTSSLLTPRNYPQEFYSDPVNPILPFCSFTLNTHNHSMFLATGNSSEQAYQRPSNFYVLRPDSNDDNPLSVSINALAIGRWK